MTRLSGPFWLRRPADMQLEQLLTDQMRAELTYGAVGATRAKPPAGYAAGHHERALGYGDETFARAVAALKEWAPHQGAGMQLTPARPSIAAGQVVLMLLPLAGVYVTAAARIVYVVDEPDRYGFAYGTLPHHPEEGEEAFLVERGSDGRVRFVIDVFSRPAHPLVKSARPVARLIQAWATNRYLDGLQAATA